MAASQGLCKKHKVPTPLSDTDLEKLRRFSPAAARSLGARPELARFLDAAPSPRVLERARDLDADSAARLVRLLRARVFVHTAWQEANGASPLESGRLWSELADAAIRLIDHVAFRELCARSGAPTDDEGREVGRAVFGLGKLGSRELNPSSDVDLLFVYGTDAGSAGPRSLHEAFTRWAHRVRELLARVTDEGFAFRVDLDLRPEGTTGPLVNSVDALESYYESFGLTWERAALLRLRPIVDKGGVADEVRRRLRPFVFPRVHDLSAVDDLAAMKHRVTAAATQDGFDVKRGHGGIREVEFVGQALQLLHGGRMPEIRSGSTVEVLAILEETGLLPHRMAKELTESYEFLRRLEHALQYWEDRQTQVLPASGPGRARVVAALLEAAADTFRGQLFDVVLEEHRARVHRVFTAMLGEERDDVSADARLALSRKAPDEERVAALARMGLSPPEDALRLVRMLERRRASPFSPRARADRPSRASLAGQLLDAIAESPDAMAALARLPDLFSGLHHFGLLERLAADRRLLALLVRVLSVSAPLSRLLSRQADLEEILLHGAFAERPSRGRLLEELRRDLDLDDEEARLVRMRRVHGRVTLGVGLAFLGGRLDVVAAGHRLSTLADAILEDALCLARRKIARRYGEPEGARFGVCALGRLGGRELGFFADVDLVFVYEASGATSGPRSIAAGEWASRVAQQVIWMVGAPLLEGRCYEVDTRLRPSGNQGPLVTHVDAFEAYHRTRAELWERQALLRLRPVVAEPELSVRIRQVVRGVAAQPAPSHLGMRLLDMRARIVKERAEHADSSFDVKLGEGGMSDVEFAIQGLQLKHGGEHPSALSTSTRRALQRLSALGIVAEEDAVALRRGYDRLATLREALVLVDDRRSSAVSRLDRRLALLARAHPVTKEIAAGATLGPEVFDGLVDEAARLRELSHRILVRL